MRELLRKILSLQPDWSSDNTPAMQERGLLVRREVVGWLRERLPSIVENAPEEIDDWRVEARDGTGLKNEIPWARVYSASRSRSATVGWYIVYLFGAQGDRVYLSLNQGTTRWEKGDLHARPVAELRQRARWAYKALSPLLQSRVDLVEQISLEARKSPLGPAYEAGNVMAFEYALDRLPNEKVLAGDLQFLASVLGHLYQLAEQAIDLPGDLSPEVVDALVTAERSAGKTRKGQGLRLTSVERTAIERQAVTVAMRYLTTEGFTVTDVGATQSYDLDALRGEQHLFVEVKGTTSMWSSTSEIILTKNEVDLHEREYPNNMLVVVSQITLDRTATPPSASGGELHVVHPWQVLPSKLTPVTYRYVVGE
ncbi:MrcB family domain-containing protein [Actinosynnema sp. NPDC053489]|uniref:MrcB family domain-containing protein n=1 Tax=Actinosynnema sp. NPDC053489 TaxID=3363916 RepID=UPI0037C9A1CF